ncbi:MAG: hypothetical protein ACTSX4_01860 [Candidatus Helarchaeota archaeon]
MAKGIALIKWDDHFGASLDSVYPKDLEINNEIALQLYTSQTMGDISTPRFSIFQTNEIKVASYFGGDKKNILLVIVLNENEDPEKYKLFLIQSFSKLISNNTKIDDFLEQNFRDIELLESFYERDSITQNKKIMNFFFNVIQKEIKEIPPKIDYNLGIHYPKLEENLNVMPGETDIFLDYLSKQNYLIPEVIDNMFICPLCNSIKNSMKIICPKCSSKKIEKNITLQHKLCGHVDFYKNFYDILKNHLFCRKCNSTINDNSEFISKGISYKCMDCNQFFKIGREIFECNNCLKIFNKDDLTFKPIYSYKVNLEKINLLFNYEKV